MSKLVFPHIFFINFGVTDMISSFRLVLEGKASKEIPKIRVLIKDFCKQLCFITCRSWIINNKKYSRFPFVENANSNSTKDATQFLGSYRLLFY